MTGKDNIEDTLKEQIAKEKEEVEKVKRYFYHSKAGVFCTEMTFAEYYTSGKDVTDRANKELLKMLKDHPSWSMEKIAKKVAEKMKLRRLDKVWSMEEIEKLVKMAEDFFYRNINQ